jgi:leader peptidase (prepilin peptidase)/N-methyltransferase
MGFGDVKLLAMVGAFLGWRGALGTLIIASMVGSVIGLGMLLYLKLRGPVEREAPLEPETDEKAASSDEEITLEGHYLPFGPYLALGAIVFMFVGPEIIEAYFSLLAPSMEPVYFFDDIDMAL